MLVESIQMAVPVTSSGGTAESALAKLGDLSSTLTFDLVGSRMSRGGELINQTVSGDMPVMNAEGREVLRLAFQSSNRGKHLHASLKLPSGEAIADLHMGTPPQGGAVGMFNSIGASYSLAPPPPIQLSVLGQAYATYTCSQYMNMLIQSDARWNRADGTGGAAVSVESPQNMCCFCIPNAADQTFSRKKSPLGKREVMMNVHFDGATSTEGTSVHLISDSKEGRMKSPHSSQYRRVMCELDGSSGEARKRLDLLLISASLAAVNVTQPEVGGGGGA